MSTTLFRIKFKDGREWRVFCANNNQAQRLFTTLENISFDYENEMSEITSGIHTIKQWEQIVNNLKKE